VHSAQHDNTTMRLSDSLRLRTQPAASSAERECSVRQHSSLTCGLLLLLPLAAAPSPGLLLEACSMAALMASATTSRWLRANRCARGDCCGCS
jgi:hypothetical protein